MQFYDCMEHREAWFCSYEPQRPDSRYGVNVGFLTFLVMASPDIVFAVLVDVLVTEVFFLIAEATAECEGRRFEHERQASVAFKTWLVYFSSIFGYYFCIAFLFVPFGQWFKEIIPFMEDITVDPPISFVEARCPAVAVEEALSALWPRECEDIEYMTSSLDADAGPAGPRCPCPLASSPSPSPSPAPSPAPSSSPAPLRAATATLSPFKQ